MINVKLDPKMHSALKRLADQEFTSISSIVKKAIDMLLKDQGIDWRKEPDNAED